MPVDPYTYAERLRVRDTVRASGVLEHGAEVWGLLQLTGISLGPIHLHPGGCLEIAGAVLADLTVEPGAVAHIRGAVRGDIRRHPGGRVFACAGTSIDGSTLQADGRVLPGDRGRFLTLDSQVEELQADGSWQPV